MNFYNSTLLMFKSHKDKKYLFDVFHNNVLIDHCHMNILIDKRIIGITYINPIWKSGTIPHSNSIDQFKKKCFEKL